ncbi:MAG TPA: butyryl-CoA:acetate CoA-transferase [Syntrophomonas sp.]|jgi:butyryl-CoA:acetate CoA-transferase|nr:butyryl-CoA:acetate CoA-transferase [Syntrophomonas sp.]
MKSYLDEYRRKLITAKQAASLVRSGDIVEYGQFATKPIDFDVALGTRAGEEGLYPVTVRTTGTVLPVPEVVKGDPEQKTFLFGSWYFTAVDRKMCDYGLDVHYPFNYHEATGLLYNKDYAKRWPSVWCAMVTPMDKHGFFNFGLATSSNRPEALNARVAIVEVNENMPRCLGGFEEGVHISEIDYIVESNNSPVFSLPPTAEATPEEKVIAELIVEEITDGACLQLGIGALPNTIGQMLAQSDLKDLGVQSEMFCDAMVDMYEAGRITNARKNVDRYKSTYTFCLGTQDTYDFLDNNSMVASCPVVYTNDPCRVRLNDNVVSINNILEIDLLTQVCSETKGLRQISGTGGQLDFVIGAFESKGGKSFLAFRSTFEDKDGTLHSRVRPLLTPGAVTTVPRTLVNWVVTEYGKVNLKSLSVYERAEAIISIAHPQFRDELIKQANEMKLWRPTNRIP